jgi:hypothetical protein
MRVGQGRVEMRSTSKRLFNSQYRIEVAELVGAVGDGFTTQALADALDLTRNDLPWSCVTKELAVLVSVGLLTRATTRTPDGRIPYSLGSGFPAFLAFIRTLHPPTLDSLSSLGSLDSYEDERGSNITPIRRRGTDT